MCVNVLCLSTKKNWPLVRQFTSNQEVPSNKEVEISSHLGYECVCVCGSSHLRCEVRVCECVAFVRKKKRHFY